MKRKDEEKQDLLRMNQELQQKVDQLQNKGVQEGLRATEEDSSCRPQNTHSLPSGHTEGEYIEEEHEFSFLKDAGKGLENDILKQLQNERERSDKLSKELKDQRARIVTLEAELDKTSKQLTDRSLSYEVEKTEICQRHEVEVKDLEKKVDELTLAAQVRLDGHMNHVISSQVYPPPQKKNEFFVILKKSKLVI